MKTSALQRNPFCVLGASVRDSRHRIIELAEERLLDLDQEQCEQARLKLLNPRTRLAAEITWLPGVAPRRAAQLVERLRTDPASIRLETGLPKLAHANLLAAVLESAGAVYPAREVAQHILEAAAVAGDIAPADVVRDINEDRAVARFPAVGADEQLDEQLAEHARYLGTVFCNALDGLETRALVAAMTEIVQVTTRDGELQPPPLIDDLVNAYEVRVRQFLQDEARNVTKLIAAIRDAAPGGESAIAPLLESLSSVVRNWDGVAQPVQLCARARGTEHAMSKELGWAIRRLAVDLFNQHEMLDQARQLTDLLRDAFAELPELSEALEEDSETLKDLQRQRGEAKSQEAAWAKEITYRADVGMVFKNTLSISPEGVAWKGAVFPLERITRVRWGGTRHSVNGIPTGTTYTIAFGDEKHEAVAEFGGEDVYGAFVDRLWRAVGVRLIVETLQSLKSGKIWRVGQSTVQDDGITLMRHKLFSVEPVKCAWNAIRLHSMNGALHVASLADGNTNVSLSYTQENNVHILEHMLRLALNKPGLQRLSDILDGD